MLRLIPSFIQRCYIDDKLNGSFSGATMFVDVAGFTSLTKRLLTQEKRGAEKLSEIINRIYKPIIDRIHSENGFVANFAGDSVTAIFPSQSIDTAVEPAVNAAFAIQKAFNGDKTYYNKQNIGADINVRIGVSAGDVNWSIFANDANSSYCFYGKPVVDCSNVAIGCKPGDIAISDIALACLRADDGKLTFAEYEQNSCQLAYVKKAVLERFFPKSFTSLQIGGEFRKVTSVFVSFEWKDDEFVDSFVSDVMQYATSYGGYFNGIFYDDKGPHLLVLFGAPVSYENDAERATDFADAVVGGYPSIVKIGINYGSVYAGTVGYSKRCTYTALGNSVNQAARLMEAAEPGQILMGADYAEQIKQKYDIEKAELVAIKSKDISNDVYIKVGKASAIEVSEFFEGEMVGRTEELSRLIKETSPIFDNAFGGVLYIYGGAGIGKSRLIYELNRELGEKAQSYILQTDSILRKSFNPFVYTFRNYFEQSDIGSASQNFVDFEWVWDNLIERLNSVSDTDLALPIISELQRTKSLIGALLGHSFEGSLYEKLDAQGKYENTSTAIIEFIKALSLLSPTVFIFEDIQWLDEDSKAVLTQITRDASENPFIIICTSRYDDDGSKPTLILDDDILTTEIELANLATNSGVELIESRLDGTTSSGLFSFILNRTEGNPFYIEQFCQYLQENDLIRTQDGILGLVGLGDDIPEGINSILTARLDRLTKNLKELVQTAAVLGREFDVSVLSKIITNNAIEPLLLQGESQHIWSLLTEIKYIFRHTLLRDAAYQMLLGKTVRNLHKLAGEVIEEVYPDDENHYADIAYHYNEAKVADKAKEYLVKAAIFANDNYMNSEGIELYKKALEYVTDPLERYDTNLKITGLLDRVGLWDEEKEYYEKNLEIADELNDENLKARALNTIGRKYSFTGQYDLATENLSSAKKIFDRLQDNENCSETYCNIGTLYMHTGEFDKANEHFLSSIEFAKRIPSNEKDNRLLMILPISEIGTLNSLYSNYDVALEWMGKALNMAREFGFEARESTLLGNMGIVYMNSGDFEMALEHFDKSLTIFEEYGFKRNISILSGNMGQLYGKMGEFTKAKELLDKQAEMSILIGDKPQVVIAYYNAAELFLEIPDYEVGLQYLREGYEIAEKLNNDIFFCVYRAIEAEYNFELGDVEEAKRLNDIAIKFNKDAKFPDAIFDTKLLNARILAVSDKYAGVQQLLGLLDKFELDNQKAKILFYLTELTNDDSIRTQAIELLRSLYEVSPDYQYKRKLEKLNG